MRMFVCSCTRGHWTVVVWRVIFLTGLVNTEIFINSRSLATESVFSKGQSKRIWNELYKVSRINFFILFF